jgi:hypothetical protein
MSRYLRFSASTSIPVIALFGVVFPAVVLGAPKPLPQGGCMLLSKPEVSTLLGVYPKCTQVRRIDSAQDLEGGTWAAPRGGPVVQVSISRTKAAVDKATFENEAGTKATRGAKVIGGIGDDAVLIAEPHSNTSGAIWILRGNDIITVAVTRGARSGDALAKALVTVGRRLLATYD